MTFEPERYPYVERVSTPGMLSLIPLLPRTLRGTTSVATLGLLDSGSAVNVLPHHLGLRLGGIWERQKGFSIPSSGSLASVEARGLLLSARIVDFPEVQLAFAWAETDSVPILPGQMNFFAEFDVCFHRSRLTFEVSPKPDPSSSTNPDG